jgi:hypothetical protein
MNNGYFTLLLLLVTLAAATLPPALPVARIVVTLHQYNACEVGGSAFAGTCASIAKCYGRRLVLEVSKCQDTAEVDDFQGWVEGLIDGVQNVESDRLISADAVVGGGMEGDDDGLVIGSSNKGLAGVNTSSFDSYNLIAALLQVGQGTLSTPTVSGDGYVLQNPYSLDQWNLVNLGVPRMWMHGENGYGQTVAVLDSGVAASSLQMFEGRVVQGYDFVSDANMSKDGDGRDPNPMDPGDADEELCPSSTSGSWHGTYVSSIVSAGRFEGFSGIAYNSTLLSMRVLGKCKTGYASDVADALVWAVGGTIIGIGSNTENPASNVVMSFSGRGSCPSFLQSAVDMARNVYNATIFAAAGNNPQLTAADSFPANCKGVISVGAVGRDMQLTSYTARDANLFLPGGTVEAAVPCIGPYPLVQQCIGTSIAVPHAAGVRAIMSGRQCYMKKLLLSRTTMQAVEMPALQTYATVAPSSQMVDADILYSYTAPNGQYVSGELTSWAEHSSYVYVKYARVYLTFTLSSGSIWAVVVRTYEDGVLNTWSVNYGGYVSQQLISPVGYIKVHVQNAGTVQSTNAFSFNWTSECLFGMNSSTGSCNAPNQFCNTGSYFNTSTLQCALCRENTFAETTWQTECIPCEAGYFFYTPVGSTTCSTATNAPAGTVSFPNAYQPFISIPYKIQVKYGRVSLVASFHPWGPHYIYTSSLQREFYDTISGFQYTSNEGFINLRVQTGNAGNDQTYMSFSWTTDCFFGMNQTSGFCNSPNVTCSPGSYVDTSSNLCNPCAEGTITNTDGQTQCIACPQGSFPVPEGGTSCVNAITNISGQLEWAGSTENSIYSMEYKWVWNVDYGKLNILVTQAITNAYLLVKKTPLIENWEIISDYGGPAFTDMGIQSTGGYFEIKLLIWPPRTFTNPPLTVSWTTECHEITSQGSTLCVVPSYSCPSGWFYNKDTSTCQQCTAGTYTPSNRSVYCVACPKGTFSTNPVSSVCTTTSNNRTGSMQWTGFIDDNVNIFWTIQVINARITLLLDHHLDWGDYIFVRLDKSNPTPQFKGDHQTQLGVQLVSNTGFVEIQIITDLCCYIPDPITFSWTSVCNEGTIDTGTACIYPTPATPSPTVSPTPNPTPAPTPAPTIVVECPPGIHASHMIHTKYISP